MAYNAIQLNTITYRFVVIKTRMTRRRRRRFVGAPLRTITFHCGCRYVALLLVTVNFCFAVLGIVFFGANDPHHFKNLSRAMMTIWGCETFDEWEARQQPRLPPAVASFFPLPLRRRLLLPPRLTPGVFLFVLPAASRRRSTSPCSAASGTATTTSGVTPSSPRSHAHTHTATTNDTHTHTPPPCGRPSRRRSSRKSDEVVVG